MMRILVGIMMIIIDIMDIMVIIDTMDIIDIFDTMDIMNNMAIMKILDIMDIMEITSWMAMAGAILALASLTQNLKKKHKIYLEFIHCKILDTQIDPVV